MVTPAQPLTSWKEIARHLGVAIRTAQRWERERGLPVRHFPGARGRVAAEAAELDRWRVQNPGPVAEEAGGRRALGYVTIAGLAALALGAGAFVWLRPGGVGGLEPALGRLEAAAVVVTGAAGQELWREALPQLREAASFAEEGGRPQALVEDLDGQPGAEVLVNYDTVDREKYPPAVICFSAAGEERWRYLPGRVVTDGYRRFKPVQVVNCLAVASAGAEKLILVNSHHEAGWPDRFVVLDAAGQRVSEYWHAGRLTHLEAGDVDGDGRPEAVLAGVSERDGAATVVMLDLRGVRGASFQGEEDAYHLHGFEHAREKRRIVFQRTCISQAQPEGQSGRHAVLRLHLEGGNIRVRVRERADVEEAEVSYTLDGRLRVLAVEWSERLRSLHRDMELSGRLGHRLTEREIEGLKEVRRIAGE